MNSRQAGDIQSPIEIEVNRIGALLARGRLQETFVAAAALLEHVPHNRDVLYMLAVSNRLLNQLDDALAILARAESSHPTFSRLFQERGHCYAAQSAFPPAIEAFHRAVTLNPALATSWSALQILLQETGRFTQASAAAARCNALAALPAYFVQAAALLADGEHGDADSVVRVFLQTWPDNIEALRLLASIAVALEHWSDAEGWLRSVLAVNPEDRVARHQYATVLLQRQRHEQALEQAELLMRLDPVDASYRTVHGAALAGVGRNEEALQVYRRLVTELPTFAELHVAIGHIYKAVGQRYEAVAAYHAAASARAGYGDAYWSLANLKNYRFTDGEVAAMENLYRSGAGSHADRYHLCFALGKAFEDRRAFADSFRYYQHGNAMKKQSIRHSSSLMNRTEAHRRLVAREFFAARQGWGSAADDPIFIVGMPRSGSTLLEQILASHPEVDGTMELSVLPHLAYSLHDYPAGLADLTRSQCHSLGERYLAETRIYRSAGRRFIDKLPSNFQHIALIHLLLPNARIIDARREAMACCFSNYKQLFAAGQEYSYDFADLAQYYRYYVDVMNRWDEALPGRALLVRHEEVVSDLESNVRRLLTFCGLAFDARCVEFHKTARSIRTASSEQVRQPIYKESIDQWRNFERWLGPLRDTLAGPS